MSTENLKLVIEVDASSLNEFNEKVRKALAEVKRDFTQFDGKLETEVKATAKTVDTLESSVSGVSDEFKQMVTGAKAALEQTARSVDSLTAKFANLDKISDIKVQIDGKSLNQLESSMSALTSSTDVLGSNIRTLSGNFTTMTTTLTGVVAGLGSVNKEAGEAAAGAQVLGEKYEQAITKVGNKVTKLSQDVRSTLKQGFTEAAQSSVVAIEKMASEMRESLAALNTSFADLSETLKAMPRGVGAAADAAEKELKELEQRNSAMNRKVLADAKFMAKSVAAQVRETVTAQRALMNGLTPKELDGKFAPAAIKNVLKLDKSAIRDGTFEAQLDAAYGKLWDELKQIATKTESELDRAAKRQAESFRKYVDDVKKAQSREVKRLAGGSASAKAETFALVNPGASTADFGALQDLKKYYTQIEREGERAAKALTQAEAKIRREQNDLFKTLSRRSVAGQAASFAMVNAGSTEADFFTLKNLGNYYKEQEKQATKAAKANTTFNRSLNDMHSAARGVASGFNAMWLTWGNIGPLLAGAALSNAFVQTVKQGAELTNQLEFVRVLGGESAESVDNLRSTLLQLGTETVAGPQEIAAAMKTLALAGVAAKDSAIVIKDAINLSTVGVIELQAASETLVGVATAFSIPVENFGRVGDVISKAAAVSQSSVEDLTNSMRVASAVAEQYGLGIEDTGAALAILAKRNIVGTAAGTALRNMLNELTGSSNLARKSLDKLNFKALDEATGKVKPLKQIVTELQASLKDYNPEAFQRFLKEISNERGGKLLSALLASTRNLIGNTTELDFVLKQVTESYGFNAIAAAAMATTTQNEMKRVKSALETAFVTAFTGVEGSISGIATELRQVFSDPSFVDAIQSLASGFASVIKTVVQYRNEIGALAAVYAAFKGGQLIQGAIGGAVGGFTNVAKAVKESRVEMAAYTASAAGSAVASTAVGTGLKAVAGGARIAMAALGPVSAALAIGAMLASQFFDETEKIREADKKSKLGSADSMIQYLEDEERRLRIKLDLLNKEKDAKLAIADVNSVLAIQKLEEEKFAAIQAERDKWVGGNSGGPMSDQLKAKIQAIAAEFNVRIATLSNLAGTVTRLTKEVDDKSPKPTQTFGPKGYPGIEEAFRQQQALQKGLANGAKQLADLELELLKAKNRAKILSDSEYLTAVQALRSKEQYEIIKALEDEKKLVLANNELKEAEKAAEVGRIDNLIRQTALQNSLRVQIEETKKIGDDVIARDKIALDLQKAREKTVDDLTEAQKEFNAQYLSKEDILLAKAALDVEKQFEKVVNDSARGIAEKKAEIDALWDSAEGPTLTNLERLEDELAKREAISAQIQDTIKQLKAQAQAQALANEAAKNDPVRAARKAMKEYAEGLTEIGELAEGITKGALKELEDAFVKAFDTKKLNLKGFFDYIEAELKRFAAKQLVVRITGVLDGTNLTAQNIGAIGAGLTGGAGGMALNQALAGGAGAQVFNSFASSGIGQSLGLSYSATDPFTGEAANILTQGATEFSQALTQAAPYAGAFVQLFQGDARGAAASAVGVYAGQAIGSYLASAGTAFAGPIGAAAGLVIGQVLGGLFKDRPPSFHGNYDSRVAGGNMNIDNSQALALSGAARNAGESLVFAYRTIAQDLEVTADDLDVLVQNSIIRNGERFDTTFQAFLNGMEILETERFKTGDQAEAQEWLARRADRIILASLQAAGAGSAQENVVDFLQGLGDVAELTDDAVSASLALVSALDDINDRFGQATTVFGNLAGISAEAFVSLVQARGGVEGLNESMGAFYTAFTSEEQRLSDLRSDTAQALLRAGIAQEALNALVDENGEFVGNARNLVREYTNQLDLNNASQLALFNTILNLTPAIDQLLPSLDDLADGAASVEQAYNKLIAQQRTADEIAQERLNLERSVAKTQADLFESLGETGAARAYELSLLDESNRAIQERLFVLQDEIEIAKEQQSLSEEIRRLQAELAFELGDTNAVREYELSLINESNRGLQQRVFDLEDEIEKQRELAEAAKEAREELAQLGESIVDYVRKLDITDPSLSPEQRLGNAQTEFSRLLQLAQGGDTDALGNITGASDDLLDAARDYFGSTEAYQQILAAVKASLLDLPAVQTYEEVMIEELQAIKGELQNLGGELAALAGNIRLNLLDQFAEVAGASRESITREEFISAYGELGLGESIDGLYDLLDINSDNLISEVEALAATFVNEMSLLAIELNDGFDKIDTNLDGQLSFDEVKSAFGQVFTDSQIQALLTSIDADGNGVISQLETANGKFDALRTEIVGNFGTLFGKVDLNTDAQVTQEEFRTAFASLGLGTQLDAIFRELDTDGNGVITRLEAANAQRNTGNGTQSAILARLSQDSILSYSRAQVEAAYASGGYTIAGWLQLVYGQNVRIGEVIRWTYDTFFWTNAVYNRLGDVLSVLNAINNKPTSSGGTGTDNGLLTNIRDGVNSSNYWLNLIASRTYDTAIHTAQSRDHLSSINSKLGQPSGGGGTQNVYVTGGYLSVGGFVTVTSSNRQGTAAYFADGGVFTNSIVNRATSFPMGVMGEAGPEAIMPLTRGADGSLGVKQIGPSPMIESMSRLNAAQAEQTARLVRELQELNRHTAAIVRVQQAAAKQTVEKLDSIDRRLESVERRGRLEKSK